MIIKLPISKNMGKSIAKLAVIAFMVYNFWLRFVIGYSQIVLYALVALVLLCSALAYNLNQFFKYLPPICGWLMLLGLYSLVSGLIIADDTSHLMISVLKYFASVMVCICICRISIEEKSLMWLAKWLVVISVLCCVQTLTHGYGTRRFSMSADNNTNYLGIFLTYGIFCLLYLYREKKDNTKKILLLLAIALLFLYVIVLTGSRKSLIGSMILLGLWVVIICREYWIKVKLTRLLGFVGLLAIVVGIGYRYFLTEYLGSYGYERMMALFNDSSDNMRWRLISDALQVFSDHPLFGVGFNQFYKYSFYGIYSHCTIPEILACCGMLGAVMFICPFGGILKSLFKSIMLSGWSYHSALVLALFAVMAFFSIGSILIYDAHNFIYLIVFIGMTAAHTVTE